MHSHQCQGPNTVANTTVITASMVRDVLLVVSQCHSMTSADSTSKQPTVAASTVLGADWPCWQQSNRFEEGELTKEPTCLPGEDGYSMHCIRL